MSAARLVNLVVAMADTPPSDIDPVTGKGPEWGKAAPIGLLVILLLGIATFFLMRSMTRKINSVPASFDPPEEASQVPAAPDDDAQAVGVDEQPEQQRAGPEPGGPGLVDERIR